MAQGGSAVPADKAEAALLDALFTQSPVGLHVLDTDLRVVRINTATQGMQGVRTEDLIGRHFADAYGLAEPEENEALLREVLATGNPVREHIVRAHRPGTRVEHFYAVSVFRLQDSRETILGVALAVIDVTEQVKARARMRVLGVVRERVGRTLDVVVACEDLVAALVPAFADVAIVEVVDAVVRGDDPPLSPSPGAHRCAAPDSAPPTLTCPSHTRSGTSAASPPPPRSRRPCPTCAPVCSPCTPTCPGSRPTRIAPRRSGRPEPGHSSSPR